MELTRIKPFTRALRRPFGLTELFDEVLPSFFEETEGFPPQGVWSPRMDLVEDEKGYTAKFDLPGIPKENIKVEFQDGELRVSGSYATEEKEEKPNYRRMERHRGSFFRTLALPNVSATEKISATFQDGVLKVEIPKAEAPVPKSIPIS